MVKHNQRKWYSFLSISIICLGCSIHIGNPKDFEGKERKSKPEVSMKLSSQPLEQGDELTLNFEQIVLINSNGGKQGLELTNSASVSISEDSNWLGSIISSSSIEPGTYVGIEITVPASGAGSLSVGGSLLEIEADDASQRTYPISLDFTIEAGRSGTLFINFTESEGLIPVSEDGVVKSFKLGNGFKSTNVSLKDLDAQAIEARPPQTLKKIIKTGLLFHYDVSAQDSLFSDEDCTSPVGFEGEAVACMKDLSGNGHNISQQGDGRRPLVGMSQFNGHMGLIFDGDDDRLDVNFDLAAPITAHTMVAIGRFNDNLNSYRLMSFGKSDKNEHSSIGIENGALMYSFHNNDTIFANVDVTSPHILAGRYDGQDTVQLSTRKSYLDGVETPSTLSEGIGGVNTIFNDAKLVVGGEPDNGVSRLNGTVIEIIFYDRALSDQELSELNDYLKEKYGL